MLYYLIRICFLLLAFCLYLVFRKKMTHKSTGIYFIAIVSITLISFIIPIDSFFASFSTPELSYRYNHIGSGVVVAEGKQSSFLVESHNEKNNYSIIPKKNEKWKTDLGYTTRLINHKAENSFVINVYTCKNTNDYYITVLNTQGGSADISDTCDSDFSYLKYYNESLEKEFYNYYAYVDGFDIDNYILYINDTELKFQNTYFDITK